MSSDRKRHSSGGKWEPLVGYSRAVRVGNQVFVAGTTAADASGMVEGDAYEQTQKALLTVQRALEALGASLSDVVRSRIFVTHIDEWEEVGRAHGEVFGEIRPAATMVEVARLISPEMKVEIEVDAIIEGG
jgi:enamine deaminase RidA (YjgF/YER057c/UK114 family)